MDILKAKRETQRGKPEGTHTRERNAQGESGVRTAPWVLNWCGQVMFDRKKRSVGKCASVISWVALDTGVGFPS